MIVYSYKNEILNTGGRHETTSIGRNRSGIYT